MASPQADLSARRRASSPEGKGKRPRGIQKEQLQKIRKSARLGGISRLRKSKNKNFGQISSPLSSEKNFPPLLPTKGQKRPREAEQATNQISNERPRKRPRSLPASPSLGKTVDQEAASGISASQRSYISHWAEQKIWPTEFFQQDRMHHLIARQKSTASLRRKRSESSLVTSVTASDQRPREEKSAPYMKATYPALLETLGDSYMYDSDLGITDASKVIYQNFFKKEYTTPKDTLFRNDVFHTACRNLENKNEARVVQDIARLLVPSPETLAAFGAKNLNILVESVNEGWNNCVPITNPRPQPDFSVGFKRSMFSDDQLKKLQPLLGDLSCLSYFRATYYMYFPILTSEAKCGNIALDVADRQNSHSMTIAARGIVELFKLAKRENELHRELLTFSISHDHRTVRIYGYYPIIDGPKTKIYRHPIHVFDITALDGRERWTTYNFTVGVYNHSLTLLKKICAVIDELPSNFNLVIAQQSELQLSEASGLSAAIVNQLSAGSQQTQVDLQQLTPDTSMQAEKPVSKKKKNDKERV